jgi:hypothetical protein
MRAADVWAGYENSTLIPLSGFDSYPVFKRLHSLFT